MCVCVLFYCQCRKGCDELFLDQLFKFRPTRLVYVSCDPSTQVSKDDPLPSTFGIKRTVYHARVIIFHVGFRSLDKDPVLHCRKKNSVCLMAYPNGIYL